MPLPLALIPAALGTMKAVQGVGQGLKAKKMEKGLVRPDAVSKEEKQVLGQMGQMAYGGVPGEQQARETIARQSANTMASLGQATTDPNKLLNAISQANVSQIGAEQDLNTQIAQQKMGLLDKYLQAKSQIGATEQADKMQQFEDKAASISALKAAGRQNVMTGLQDIGGSIIAGAGGGTMGSLGDSASAVASSTPDANSMQSMLNAVQTSARNAQIDKNVLDWSNKNSVLDIANNANPTSMDLTTTPSASTSALDLNMARVKKKRRLF